MRESDERRLLGFGSAQSGAPFEPHAHPSSAAAEAAVREPYDSQSRCTDVLRPHYECPPLTGRSWSEGSMAHELLDRAAEAGRVDGRVAVELGFDGGEELEQPFGGDELSLEEGSSVA